ncbi:MAG: hypothetical protein ACD_25C00120G0006 [uncultured bacterium]|uniref:Diacylglycerol glucosyltransferase N-terminal domain-containing protein n=1 Tax=candidate division WWE3 bacterium TaxID=2053526 RepID=A0A656PPJ0_UNCKA|nr:hypothetical protein P147_WWE3C00001G0365 [candidate division WWE3 bacterium RAAC2_WWE3_1]EKD94989.1 MAG: hypothetical protein ACD_25C00120G0006 [uncultured bacterium]KKS29713.1 MAG: hypothetical protein UU91_C0004G0105 [candidate division WWE3 bacterium GW2011_GWB1_42_117]KKS55523.1 MAG: hypothetical protein UV21_C0001G0105 [candidate division WWE3 bacterium GW2011_GWD2_42_34]KKT06008.1 MAG: hypothetical protein UV83_C0001G0326 [candidate division WWE3 bacterium GW2011_GWE2_43_18]KKT06926.
MSPRHFLTDPGTLVVFTYAPAGLGHLRVTNSLSAGLPKGVKTVLLGSSDKGIEAIHKFISIHVVTRWLMEWFQRGRPQKIFTFFYRKYLRSGSDEMRRKIEEIFEQQIDVPKTLVIVATHFGLAHKIAAVKREIEEKTGAKIILVVQVTDDTPQYIWYVPGADTIFVPSRKTMLELKEYALKSNLEKVKIEVLPYPINPSLSKKLNSKDFERRETQMSADAREVIDFCLPVPGAAVGMDFLHHLIPQLQSKYSNFRFHVICKEAPFTRQFSQNVRSFPNVELHTSKHDREIVDVYEKIYEENVISFEVTKPSEQSFKALYDFDMTGGSLLLFSNPVGRQERDNLDFLQRHGLIFNQKITQQLWDYADAGKTLSGALKDRLIPGDRPIRCVQLPFGSQRAANFIWWCMNNRVFESIIRNYSKKAANRDSETRSDGVALFWSRVSLLV